MKATSLPFGERTASRTPLLKVTTRSRLLAASLTIVTGTRRGPPSGAIV